MKKEFATGHQLSTQELHFFQQRQRQPANGPVVVANQISDLFNLASVFRCAEAVGGEQTGISPELMAICQMAVHIPMVGTHHTMSRKRSVLHFTTDTGGTARMRDRRVDLN